MLQIIQYWDRFLCQVILPQYFELGVVGCDGEVLSENEVAFDSVEEGQMPLLQMLRNEFVP